MLRPSYSGIAAAFVVFWLGSGVALAQQDPDMPPEEEWPPAPTAPAEREESDSRRPRLSGEEATDGEVALRRRRPRLSAANWPGRDITIEGLATGFALSMVGDGHNGTKRDYDDIFDGGGGAGARFALPMRFLQRSTTSLWAGPVLYFDGVRFDGAADRDVNGDVLITDDMRMSRFCLGGLFRIEVGRWMIEGWGALGVANTSRVSATLDETSTGGGLTNFYLYDRSGMGAAMAALKVGYLFRTREPMTIAIWGTVGAWAVGEPDASTGGPLPGPTDPGAMHGAFVGVGITVQFGLGDWVVVHSSDGMEQPARRPIFR